MKVGIFGMGAYGMALSHILSQNDCEITMWSKFEEEKEQLRTERKNEKLLPGFVLSEKIELTTSVEECAKEKDLLIIVIPVPFIDALCQELKDYIFNQHILIASKGIEQGTNLFAHEIVRKYINTNNIAIISGPSFAIDIIDNLPQGLTVASKSIETRSIVKNAFKSENIKIEETEDILGVELCGSVKNVIAIATGILEGLKVNESTRAMFMTEAINNMKELLKEFNCNDSIIMTYAGIGDLLLTATSEKSRNFSFGILLGENSKAKTIEDYLNNTTVEGYHTLISLHEIFLRENKKNDFFELIYNIGTGNSSSNDLLKYLK